MYPFLNNDLRDSNLTDNIISRHFNQNLSNELFNYQLNIGQLKNDNYQLNDDQLNDDQLNENDHSLNQLNNEEINSQFNQNKSQLENNYNQIDPEEIILNKNDKIRDLIKDCELMNNNNINNFVNNYTDNYLTNDCSIKLVSVDKCTCKCKHAKNKNKNPFHLIKSTISTLNKIKSSQKIDKKSENIQSKCLTNLEDYGVNASLSNYSLSSSSSISSSSISQAISVSSCSSVQDNYNLSNTITTVLTKPTRLPPRPPKLEIISKKPPMPPPPNQYSNKCKEIDLNNELNKIEFKDEFSIKNEDMRLLTKSFEDLLNIKAECINLKEVDDDDEIYETIDDSDYEIVNDKNDDKNDDKITEIKNEDNNEKEEDLYEDIDNLNDDEIYESLTKNELSNSLDLLNNVKDLPIKKDDYANCLSDIDRKLMKQQKILDKKRQIQKEKLKSKFGITGNEIPLNVGVVKKNHKGNNLNLNVNKDEIVLILRITGCPAGQWLAKNERGKFGYVYINSVEVDTENLKNLYNEPNILTN